MPNFIIRKICICYHNFIVKMLDPHRLKQILIQTIFSFLNVLLMTGRRWRHQYAGQQQQGVRRPNHQPEVKAGHPSRDPGG